MRPNRFREKLNADEPTIGTHIHTTWPSIVEAVGHTGQYDYVEFVGEYAPYDLHDLDNLSRAAELYNMSMMLKVDQEPRGFLAQRAVGSGFQSLLFADCHTIEEVKECARIAQPDTPDDGGSYGVATRRFSYMGYGGSAEYIQALRDVVVVLMVEKGPVVDNIEEALSVKGIDMIQWGPADFSMSTGRSGQSGSTEVKEIERRVMATALEMGVQPRAEISTADEAKYYLDLGVKHFCIGTDVSILFKWWQEQGESLKEAIAGG